MCLDVNTQLSLNLICCSKPISCAFATSGRCVWMSTHNVSGCQHTRCVWMSPHSSLWITSLTPLPICAAFLDWIIPPLCVWTCTNNLQLPLHILSHLPSVIAHLSWSPAASALKRFRSTRYSALMWYGLPCTCVHTHACEKQHYVQTPRQKRCTICDAGTGFNIKMQKFQVQIWGVL